MSNLLPPFPIALLTFKANAYRVVRKIAHTLKRDLLCFLILSSFSISNATCIFYSNASKASISRFQTKPTSRPFMFNSYAQIFHSPWLLFNLPPFIRSLVICPHRFCRFSVKFNVLLQLWISSADWEEIFKKSSIC